MEIGVRAGALSRRRRTVLLAAALLTASASASLNPVVGAQQERGHIPAWLLLGPEPFDDTTDPFRRPPDPAITGALPSAGTTTAGMGWIRVAADAAGQVNLIGVGLSQEELTSAYLHAYVWSPSERTVLLSVGSDDGVQVWVNGYDVHTNWALRGWSADQDQFPARFGVGWNRLLLRVANNTGGFGGSARVLDPGSLALLDNLRYAADRPDDYEPVQTAAVLLARRVRPAPRLEVNAAGELQFGLSVTFSNLGTLPSGTEELEVVRENGASSRRLLLREFSIGSGGTHTVSLLLDPHEVADAAVRGATFSVHFRRREGGFSGLSWTPRAEEVLRIVASEPALDPTLGAPSRDVGSTLDAWGWGEILRPDLFSNGELMWSSLLSAYTSAERERFAEEWDAVERVLTEGAEAVRDLRITFIGNAHIDMAWLWDRAETLEVVDATYSQALRFMDEYPFFMYAQSQMQTYAWADSLFPEMKDEIDHRVADGRWVPVGGMWVEPDCNLPSGESFVRQILYGKGYIRDRYGLDIRVAWNPDSFGYAWTLPMIFKGAGIDYFITQKIGWNDTTEFPYRLFWWESPDGSRVLSYFPFTYVDDASPAVLARRLSQQARQHPGMEDMLNLYGVGDHGGGPTRAMIERYLQMAGMDVFPTVEHDEPEAFMERVERKYEGEIPTWDDELYLEYHRGTYTTHADVKQWNRRMEAALEAGEKYAALANALDPGYAYPDAALDGAWKRTLFNQFHDILPGSSISEVYVDANADYDEAWDLIAGVKGGALGSLAARVRTDGRDGVPIVVFNALAWERSEVVSVPLAEVPLYPESLRVVDEQGRSLPAQIEGQDLLFLAARVPGIGYRTFWVEKTAPAATMESSTAAREGDAIVLRNGLIRATIDTHRGTVRSLVDQRTGREYLNAEEWSNELLLLEDIPSQWDAWNIGYTGNAAFVTSAGIVGTEAQGPARASVAVERWIGDSRVLTTYVLEAGSPLLRIGTQVDWNEEHQFLKAAFHPAPDADAVAFEIPYGVIERPTRPETEAEKAKWEVSGQRWIDYSDRSGSYGLAILDDAKYGYDINAQTVRLSLLRAPKYPDPGADIGTHHFAHALFPHEGGWREADVWKRGAAFNTPLDAVAVARQEGEGLGASGVLLSVGSGHVNITAVKAARDAGLRPRYVVRLVETEGWEGEAILRLPFVVARAWTANLMEDLEAELSVEPGTREIRVPVGPWKLRTLVVEPER